MPSESKPETPPPYYYRKLFWRRYWKDVLGWTLKTFWLRIGILLAVPVVLAIQQYNRAHTDWHTIWATLAIYAAVLAVYMMGRLYFTGKKLHEHLYGDLFTALVDAEHLNAEIERLSWPDNRPILIFVSWGEAPHDDPRARFHEVSEYQKEREYFERGIFMLNRGGDAHEIEVFPIELTKGVNTSRSHVARIDGNSKGFAFINIDVHNNVRYSDDVEFWNLPKVMRAIEDRLNAARVEQTPLAAEVIARYRDANGAWYMSGCFIEYRRAQGKIIFGHTNQCKFGSKKPELPEVSE